MFAFNAREKGIIDFEMMKGNPLGFLDNRIETTRKCLQFIDSLYNHGYKDAEIVPVVNPKFGINVLYKGSGHDHSQLSLFSRPVDGIAC